MAKSIKITVPKIKTRVPVPQKPPKAEEGEKKYNRRKIKKETAGLLQHPGKEAAK